VTAGQLNMLGYLNLSFSPITLLDVIKHTRRHSL